MEDVGASGKDAGFGGKHIITPPGYNGELLPGGITLPQETYNGWACLRPIIANSNPENVAKAIAFAKQIKIYPLAQANNPPATKYVNLHGPVLEGIIKLNETVYGEINDIIQEEVILERDMAMMGFLAQVGIQKGKPFNPDEDLKKVYAAAAPEALEYMIDLYHKVMVPEIYEGKNGPP